MAMEVAIMCGDRFYSLIIAVQGNILEDEILYLDEGKK